MRKYKYRNIADYMIKNQDMDLLDLPNSVLLDTIWELARELNELSELSDSKDIKRGLNEARKDVEE